MGRNMKILEELVNVLNLPHDALVHLECHFDRRLIIDAGDVETLATFARRLRLRVEPDERQAVLDYIASKGMVGVTIDNVEEAINSLLGEDRFQEPEN